MIVRRKLLLKQKPNLLNSLCLLTLVASLSCGKGFAKEQFFLNGRPISENYYQAAKLLNESVPLLQMNRNQEAFQKLDQARTLAPEIPEVHNNLGLVLAKLGRNQEALSELEQARSMKPELPATWITLGGLYQSQGQIQEAISTYSEFLKRFPGHAESGKVQSLVQGLKKELNTGMLRLGNNNASDYLGELQGQYKRWPQQRLPIRVYFHPGNNVPGFQPGYQTILEETFSLWEQAGQGLLSFQRVNRPEEANLQVSWTNNPNTFQNRAEAGETMVYCDKYGILKGTIRILTVPMMPELPVTPSRLRQICLHEIGHALGFAGHTSNPQDVMFYSLQVSDITKALSQRDINSLRLLYANQGN